MRRICFLLYSFVLCLYLFPQSVSAEENNIGDSSIEIVFVIDCSGSMKANDPSRMGLAMVQAFIDTIPSDGVRIGYVAYSDRISSFSSISPIGTDVEREDLKAEIGSIAYSGYSDIGLGMDYAYRLLSEDNGVRRMMVLISDGETDLPEGGTRTEEQSNQEMSDCIQQCREKDVPIFTIAFGQYDGSREVLEEAAEETEGQSFSAETPESLIDVLYGVLPDNLHYQMRRFSNGTYAGGLQETICVLDMPYADEINILLLSSGTIGETSIQYGDRIILFEDMAQYAVAKIGMADNAVKEMVIRTETQERQDLQAYVISYRRLHPVLEIAGEVGKNQELEYHAYFNDRNGEAILDSGFYQSFSWELDVVMPDGTGQAMVETIEAEVSGGVLKGGLSFPHSGTYGLTGTLTDSFGSYTLKAEVNVANSEPSGSIPEESCTILDGERRLCLKDFFEDRDGDSLSYTVLDGYGEGIDVHLDGDMLTVVPKKSGNHAITIQVSDGEVVSTCIYHIAVLPLWKAYWWATALGAVMLLAVMLKLLYRPKPELERLTEQKKQNCFHGKLDAYFVLQPEGEEEVPPLSFQMERVKEGRVALGDLFGDYPKQAQALCLQNIFLIAGEKRSMILYHASASSVMAGNSIICRQTQHAINFGDVVYITSPDGRYDLEIHYIAVFQ